MAAQKLGVDLITISYGTGLGRIIIRPEEKEAATLLCDAASVEYQ